MLHIKICNPEVKDLDSIYSLSQALAHYFPKPDEFVTGIHELLMNALEHGSLGIGYETKAELLRRGAWREEIIRRTALPQYAGREVEIKLTHDDKACRLTIRDQGEGFPWREYTKREVPTHRPNGRGLWIAFNSQFDRIGFNRAGNEVTCMAQYGSWHVPEHRMLKSA